jgi:hypothetical protein
MTVQCLNGFSHEVCIAHHLLPFEPEIQRIEIVDVPSLAAAGEVTMRKMRSAFVIWPTPQSPCTELLSVCCIRTNHSHAPRQRLAKRAYTALQYPTIVGQREVKSLKQRLIFCTVYAIRRRYVAAMSAMTKAGRLLCAAALAPRTLL